MHVELNTGIIIGSVWPQSGFQGGAVVVMLA